MKCLPKGTGEAGRIRRGIPLQEFKASPLAGWSDKSVAGVEVRECRGELLAPGQAGPGEEPWYLAHGTWEVFTRDPNQENPFDVWYLPRISWPPPARAALERGASK